MRRIFFRGLIFFVLAVQLFAQAPNKNWVTVLGSPDESIYIDTTSIKQYDNQISVLELTSYKKPQSFASVNKEASLLKTQLLFNIPLRKYSVIGTLYYDKSLKILGETSLPGFSSNSENFGKPIEGNQTMTAIFGKAYEYVFKEPPPPAESRIDKLNELNNVLSSPRSIGDTLIEKNTSTPRTTVENNSQDQKQDLSASDKAKVFTSPGIKDASIRIINNPISKKEQPQQLQPEKPKQNVSDTDYNTEAETNLKGTIFTDGSKYSFQVSSWKIKARAESEVQRLKAEGHNAFITEGIVKGRTWYRVRIGFFNSLEETEAYMKKVK